MKGVECLLSYTKQVDRTYSPSERRLYRMEWVFRSKPSTCDVQPLTRNPTQEGYATRFVSIQVSSVAAICLFDMTDG